MTTAKNPGNAAVVMGLAGGQDGPVLDLLRELVAEVRGLRADLASRPVKAPAVLTRADRARLARVLPAVGGELGSEEFLARDLFERESAALRIVLRGLTPKRLGKLFGRAAGHVIDGYLVAANGDELNTKLWRVLKAPGFLGNGNPGIPPRALNDRLK